MVLSERHVFSLVADPFPNPPVYSPENVSLIFTNNTNLVGFEAQIHKSKRSLLIDRRELDFVDLTQTMERIYTGWEHLNC
jgi:hypothetical protein